MKTMAPSMADLDPYRAEFDRLAKSRMDPAWLNGVRKAGWAHFSERGFPTSHDEEWRFTNISPIAKLPFMPALSGDCAVDLKSIDFADFTGGQKTNIFVFVNGHFNSELSSGKSSLALGLESQDPLIQQHFSHYAKPEANPWVALNTAFCFDGAWIRIPKGQILGSPIHLIYIATGEEDGLAIHPRNLILAEPNSQTQIIEHYGSLGPGPYFTNAVTEIVIGENAQVEHCKIQQEGMEAFHLATIQAHLARNANFLSHSISLGAKISRTDLNLVLAGEGIQAILNGLYLGKGDQLVDHHTVADHTLPRCNSHEFYHGILDDRAKGVFNGKIFVRKDAQKTDAKQTSRSLLLSSEATLDTKPQLEIFADDVKCTHGATVGQLDEEAIFYLRSRGIGKEKARAMLVHAFAGEILNRITLQPVREQLETLVEQWLMGKVGARV